MTVAPEVICPSPDKLVTGIELWSLPRAERHEVFKWFRDNIPVSFHEEVVTSFCPEPGPGTWAVMRYDDVREVTRNPDVFSNASGTAVEAWPEMRVKALGMLHMDGDDHKWYRGIVGPAFTPRYLDRLVDAMRANSNICLDNLLASPNADVVVNLVNAYPISIIAAMLSMPTEDYAQFVQWTRDAFGADIHKSHEAHIALIQYGTALSAARRANPQEEDVLTRILTAEVEGRPLTDLEVGGFISLLIGAGAETTGSTLALGLDQLARNPEQWAMLKADPTLIGGFVDEACRWATATITFRRTATQDYELGGAHIKAGDKVAIFYESANFDETHFPDPERFDITRDARRQVAFGAGGPHQCLGEQLGKREMRIFMEEMLKRVDSFEVVDGPVQKPNHRFNMVKELHMTFHGR